MRTSRTSRIRINHKRFNEMFMLQASTSPFYPLFSSLDVNAQMHRDQAGRVLWDDMVKLGIEARKAIRKQLGRLPRPVRARQGRATRARSVKWENVPTDVLAREQRYWQLRPEARPGTATAISAGTWRWSIRPS